MQSELYLHPTGQVQCPERWESRQTSHIKTRHWPSRWGMRLENGGRLKPEALWAYQQNPEVRGHPLDNPEVAATHLTILQSLYVEGVISLGNNIGKYLFDYQRPWQ